MSDLETKGRLYEVEEEIVSVTGDIRKLVDRVRNASMQLSGADDGFAIFNLGHQLEGLKRDAEKGLDLYSTLKTLLLQKTDLRKRIGSNQ